MTKEKINTTNTSKEMMDRLIEDYPELKKHSEALENITAKIYVAFMKGKKQGITSQKAKFKEVVEKEIVSQEILNKTLDISVVEYDLLIRDNRSLRGLLKEIDKI